MATFLVFKLHFNNKSVPSLKLPVVIEDRRQAPKQPQELLHVETSRRFCEGFKNTFFTEHLWTIASELLHVDFNLLDRNEKNIFSLIVAAQIFECCKIRSNCEAYQQLM